MKYILLALAVLASIFVWHTAGMKMGIMTTYLLIGTMFVISALKSQNNSGQIIWIGSLFILTAISFHPYIYNNEVLWPISVFCHIISLVVYFFIYL